MKANRTGNAVCNHSARRYTQAGYQYSAACTPRKESNALIWIAIIVIVVIIVLLVTGV